MAVKHNERCKECKERVFELLSELFGKIETNYNLNLPINFPNITKHFNP